MASLLETLNSTREATISLHYGAATAELTDKIKDYPLQTVFNIESGCVSKEISDEIAFRFREGGLSATVMVSGIVRTKYYLVVNVNLPESLVHPEPEKKEEVVVVEESKVEITVVEETKVVEEAKVESA